MASCGEPSPIVVQPPPSSSANQDHLQSAEEQNSRVHAGDVKICPAMILLGSASSLHPGRFVSIFSFLETTSESSSRPVVYLSSSVYPVCHASEFVVVSGTGCPR